MLRPRLAPSPHDPQASLLQAIANQDLDGMQAALSNGAGGSVADRFGAAPIHHAVAAGHVAPVQWLLERDPGACAARDRRGVTPFHLAALGTSSDASAIVQQLDRARSRLGGVRTPLRDHHGRTPLRWATDASNLGRAADLIAAGANPFLVDAAGSIDDPKARAALACLDQLNQDARQTLRRHALIALPTQPGPAGAVLERLPAQDADRWALGGPFAAILISDGPGAPPLRRGLPPRPSAFVCGMAARPQDAERTAAWYLHTAVDQGVFSPQHVLAPGTCRWDDLRTRYAAYS
jgi:hypothetical protein